MSNHTSYYINVGQTIGVVGGLILAWRALDIEAKKAGIQERTIGEVLKDDAARIRTWYDNTFGPKTYTHR